MSKPFAPGSEWLLVKTYGGWQTIDDWLSTDLAPALEALVQCRLLDSWSFLRLADPDWHLAVRCQIPTPSEHFPRLSQVMSAVTERAIASDTIWKVDWCSFVPEYYRFGGQDGWNAAQQLFYADSRFAAAICAGHPSEWRRWLVAMACLDQLCTAWQMPMDRRLELTAVYRNQLEKHARDGRAVHARLFRERRHEVLESIGSSLRVLGWGDPFARRGEQCAHVVSTLVNRLPAVPAEYMMRCMHLSVNRCVARGHAATEYAIADLLCLYYRSVLGAQTNQDLSSSLSSSRPGA